jgi:hypothetical protein
MVQFGLNFDMRAPDFGAPSSTIYPVALEMTEWADQKGLHFVSLQEHHGSPDGYISCPFVLGGALASRTRHMRIQLGAVILPLHDPVKVAEQIAVLDLVSGGRLTSDRRRLCRARVRDVSVTLRDRARLLNEGIPIIQRALSGERLRNTARNSCARCRSRKAIPADLPRRQC